METRRLDKVWLGRMVVMTVLMLLPAQGRAGWHGGGRAAHERGPSHPPEGAWGAAVHSVPAPPPPSAPSHPSGGAGGSLCSQCHGGTAWHGRIDGDHDRGGHEFHEHGHRARGEAFVGAGPEWWGPPPDWWYAPPDYTGAPPTVVEDEPPQYVERQSPEGYWYYCPSSGAYYPKVETCTEPWVKVLPRAP